LLRNFIRYGVVEEENSVEKHKKRKTKREKTIKHKKTESRRENSMKNNK
jgi:hypothetical protein